MGTKMHKFYELTLLSSFFRHVYQEMIFTKFAIPCKTIIFYYCVRVNILNRMFILLSFRRKLFRIKLSPFNYHLEISHRKAITIPDTIQHEK